MNLVKKKYAIHRDKELTDNKRVILDTINKENYWEIMKKAQNYNIPNYQWTDAYNCLQKGEAEEFYLYEYVGDWFKREDYST